jgi:UDP-3-O-acyl-N-acetylglucosamine deacetylase
MATTLRARINTTFKQDWRDQSANIAPQDRYQARANQQFPVSSIDRNAQLYGGDHWKVTFTRPLQPSQGQAKTTWYVYVPHVELSTSANTSTATTLRARINTTFKQDWREQSTNAAPQDRYQARANQQFPVSSIDRNAQLYGGDHWKVTFARPLQPSQGQAKTTWYVYVPHVELSTSANTSTAATLRIRTNTTFKQDWRAQAVNIAPQDRFEAKAGQRFPISSIDRNAQLYGGDHWRVTFTRSLQPSQGQAKTTWYVYVPHVVYESSVSKSDRNIASSTHNKYITQSLLHSINGSPSIKAVTNVNLLSPSSVFLLCFLCTSAVRWKNSLNKHY